MNPLPTPPLHRRFPNLEERHISALDLGLREGYMRALMKYAEEGTIVDDDIDADSASDDGDDEMDCTTGPKEGHELKQTSTPANNVLASAESETSCRISRIPFNQPGEVPELVPDQEDALTVVLSPSTPGPMTPPPLSLVAVDSMRPRLFVTSPDTRPLPAGVEMGATSGRKQSFATIRSDASMGIILEEEDNAADFEPVSPVSTAISVRYAVSEFSLDQPAKRRHQRVPSTTTTHSVATSTITVTGRNSEEWRMNNLRASPRRSSSLLSRLRNAGRRGSRAIGEEEFIEKRTLTPLDLMAPPLRRDDVPPGISRPPMSSSSSSGLSEISSRRTLSREPLAGPQSQPKPVFGVDLNTSIRVAPMRIRISHKGQSTSYRTFPLGVYKCCEFIRKSGCSALNLFSSPGNTFNIAQLKEIFNSAPTYGESFDFAGTEYTVHDAARLILLYLEELPKPLIPASVVKSWVLLARQEGAIEPPCPRVESGLDFWTEALNRLPVANRNLAKHLLTLFAEVLPRTYSRGDGSARTEISEADARQLASVVSRALFHHDAEGNKKEVEGDKKSKKKQKKNNNSVHPTLALAFLIKKRGEYTASLGHMDDALTAGKGKNASTNFLPSTKEILEWKGR
ncbi:Rho GTPase activation protein [Podospora didyma]|uniref:Rho GTPase activation protein n=1 Tax=Podospora didyma TaxID=330526 RepID=A0AAE0NY65_9PEZI|nr:Rho GTPase activation protein [Podospora didyma]